MSRKTRTPQRRGNDQGHPSTCTTCPAVVPRFVDAHMFEGDAPPERKRPSRRDAETAMDRVEGKPTAINSLTMPSSCNGLTREFFP